MVECGLNKSWRILARRDSLNGVDRAQVQAVAQARRKVARRRKKARDKLKQAEGVLPW